MFFPIVKTAPILYHGGDWKRITEELKDCRFTFIERHYIRRLIKFLLREMKRERSTPLEKVIQEYYKNNLSITYTFWGDIYIVTYRETYFYVEIHKL